jgi:hypothetical protein
MTDPARSQGSKTRLIMLLSAAGLVALAFIGVGIYGLVTGPRTGSEHAAAPRTLVPSATPSAGGTMTSSSLPPLPKTTDPERFARAVATSLFTWDTTAPFDPQAHIDVILKAADPSGEETPGLINDLDYYLPSTDTWRTLAQYQTAQTLTIDTIRVPAQWYQAVAEAHGRLADGLTAYTVHGTRHRTGVWFNKPVSSANPVSFTMFLSCPPATSTCRILRLSQLNNPLN